MGASPIEETRTTEERTRDTWAHSSNGAHRWCSWDNRSHSVSNDGFRRWCFRFERGWRELGEKLEPSSRPRPSPPRLEGRQHPRFSTCDTSCSKRSAVLIGRSPLPIHPGGCPTRNTVRPGHQGLESSMESAAHPADLPEARLPDRGDLRKTPEVQNQIPWLFRENPHPIRTTGTKIFLFRLAEPVKDARSISLP